MSHVYSFFVRISVPAAAPAFACGRYGERFDAHFLSPFVDFPRWGRCPHSDQGEESFLEFLPKHVLH